MNSVRTTDLCTIERSPGRILLRVRHEPALLPGALTPARQGARTLRGFAARVAAHLNEACAAKGAQGGQVYFPAPASAPSPSPSPSEK